MQPQFSLTIEFITKLSTIINYYIEQGTLKEGTCMADITKFLIDDNQILMGFNKKQFNLNAEIVRNCVLNSKKSLFFLPLYIEGLREEDE